MESDVTDRKRREVKALERSFHKFRLAIEKTWTRADPYERDWDSSGHKHPFLPMLRRLRNARAGGARRGAAGALAVRG